MARPDLRLQQRSMWLAYPMLLLDPAGQQLGMLDWPGGGGATGERAKPRDLPLDLRGRRYRITQTTLPKGWNSDLRLQLWGAGAMPLASLDIQAADRHGARLQLTAPVHGEVPALPDRLRIAHAIRLADGRQGSVQEPSWLSLRRTLDVRLPHADDALRAFLGAAVLIARTSNTGTRW